MAGTDPGHVNTAALSIPLHNFPSLLLCAPNSQHLNLVQAHFFLPLALMMGEFDLRKKRSTNRNFVMTCCKKCVMRFNEIYLHRINHMLGAVLHLCQHIYVLLINTDVTYRYAVSVLAFGIMPYLTPCFSLLG